MLTDMKCIRLFSIKFLQHDSPREFKHGNTYEKKNKKNIFLKY